MLNMTKSDQQGKQTNTQTKTQTKFEKMEEFVEDFQDYLWDTEFGDMAMEFYTPSEADETYACEDMFKHNILSLNFPGTSDWAFIIVCKI